MGVAQQFAEDAIPEGTAFVVADDLGQPWFSIGVPLFYGARLSHHDNKHSFFSTDKCEYCILEMSMVRIATTPEIEDFLKRTAGLCEAVAHHTHWNRYSQDDDLSMKRSAYILYNALVYAYYLSINKPIEWYYLAGNFVQDSDRKYQYKFVMPGEL